MDVGESAGEEVRCRDLPPLGQLLRDPEERRTDIDAEADHDPGLDERLERLRSTVGERTNAGHDRHDHFPDVRPVEVRVGLHGGENILERCLDDTRAERRTLVERERQIARPALAAPELLRLFST